LIITLESSAICVVGEGGSGKPVRFDRMLGVGVVAETACTICIICVINNCVGTVGKSAGASGQVRTGLEIVFEALVDISDQADSVTVGVVRASDVQSSQAIGVGAIGSACNTCQGGDTGIPFKCIFISQCSGRRCRLQHFAVSTSPAAGCWDDSCC